MTHKERLERLYRGEVMDRPGIYVRPLVPENDPTYDRLVAYLREHTELKRWWSTRPVRQKLPVEAFTEPYSDDFQRQVTVLHTPAGDVRQSYLVSLTGRPGLHEEHFIKTVDDAGAFLAMPPRQYGGDVSGFFAEVADLGDAGLVEVNIDNNAAGRVVAKMGSETFALWSVQHRDLLHELIRHEQRDLLAMTRCLLDAGVGPYYSLSGQEYIVPPVHGPADFMDFNVRYDKEVIATIHEAGGTVHVHCHGRVGKVFEGFIEMGADVVHPFESPPLGDITAAEAKERSGGAFCLEGNIQIANFYERTPEQIAEETAGLIADAFGDRRNLIVCPTASPYMRGAGERCFGQFKAMIDTVLNWRP